MSSKAFRRSLSGFNRKDVIEYIAVLSKRLDASASEYAELKKKYDELAGKDIVDTDALTTKFYLDFLIDRNSNVFNKVDNLANAINSLNDWDLVLFLEPTTKFVQDGTRSDEIKANREKYSNKIKTLFDSCGIKYIPIDGDYLNRLEESKKHINNLFKQEEC